MGIDTNGFISQGSQDWQHPKQENRELFTSVSVSLTVSVMCVMFLKTHLIFICVQQLKNSYMD